MGAGGGTTTAASILTTIEYTAARAAQTVFTNRAAYMGAAITYGVLAPPGSPDFPGPWDDVGKSFQAYRSSASGAPGGVSPGGTGQALAGHGIETTLAGTARVPQGTTVVAPPAGMRLPDRLGAAIEGGRWWEVAADPQWNSLVQTGKFRIFGPGAEMPNLILRPGNDLTLYANSIRVAEDTPIGNLLKPDMGWMYWAACTQWLQ
ncbi:MAG: putative adhesin [Bryobacteraceae bacterium]